MASSEPCGRTHVKKKSGRRYCSVKDCHSREGTPGVRLYSFPSKPWEKSRRQKWIIAVRRVNFGDSSSWQPNRDSRVCSKHFVNGEKSTIESHPGYVPTIFPIVYKKRSTSATAQLARFHRWKQRHSSSSAPSAALSSPDGVTSPATPAPDAFPGSPSPHTTETAESIGTDLLYEQSSTEGLDILSTVAAELRTAVKSVVLLSEKVPEQIQLVRGATLMGAVTSQEHETIESNCGKKGSKVADMRWSACVIGDTSVGGADVSALVAPPDDCWFPIHRFRRCVYVQSGIEQRDFYSHFLIQRYPQREVEKRKKEMNKILAVKIADIMKVTAAPATYRSDEAAEL
ncbi:hypothetical protein HPB50_028751 [Hyalomma asiaticum]|nr:hypothetical protein HPB50_028751 [Hyalomma asiaticum]